VPVSCEVSVFGLGAGWILGAVLDTEAVDLPWRGRRVGFDVGCGAMEFEFFTLFWVAESLDVAELRVSAWHLRLWNMSFDEFQRFSAFFLRPQGLCAA
jgi:hypothetical protein